MVRIVHWKVLQNVQHLIKGTSDSKWNNYAASFCLNETQKKYLKEKEKSFTNYRKFTTAGSY